MLKPKSKLILASSSPRRQQLLKELGWDFTIRTKDTAELYSSELKGGDIAVFLAELKAKAFVGELQAGELLITADTIVCLKDEVLGKPKDEADAKRMLQSLSGQRHDVITAISLMSSEKLHTFQDLTEVYFRKLSAEEIEYYVQEYKPYDKAGAYGAQEWMGFVAVEKIIGSYFNVMGLPVHKLYDAVMRWET